MSTTMSLLHSEPISIPNNNATDEEQTYKEMIKQLAAQAPEPYGAIPPLLKKQKKKKKKKRKQKEARDNNNDEESRKGSKKLPIRRMSHVENWVAVDSKESIPDDEDLRYASPFRNFLSTDFLVLPLHMPPPSLSATPSPPVRHIIKKKSSKSDLRPIVYPIKDSPIQVIDLDDDDEEEEEEEESDLGGIEAEDEEDEEDEEDTDDDDYSLLCNKRSIPSFSKSQLPSTSTTKSYAMSSSPPPALERSRWLETIAQLRKSLIRSSNDEDSTTDPEVIGEKTTGLRKRIPLPPPPPSRRKRRSEATTQPRFNPETNTYTRDTRFNPDHLRMISAELNMMRSRKLSSPLKPRGFLPRRTDAFIRGDQRKLSCLHNELVLNSCE